MGQKLYRVRLRQAAPIDVWADDTDEAFVLAMEECEWDDDYEVLKEREEEE